VIFYTPSIVQTLAPGAIGERTRRSTESPPRPEGGEHQVDLPHLHQHLADRETALQAVRLPAADAGAGRTDRRVRGLITVALRGAAHDPRAPPSTTRCFWLYVLPTRRAHLGSPPGPVLESKRLPELIIFAGALPGRTCPRGAAMTALTEERRRRRGGQDLASGPGIRAGGKKDPQAQADRRKSKGRRTADRQSRTLRGASAWAPPRAGAGPPSLRPRPTWAPTPPPGPLAGVAGPRPVTGRIQGPGPGSIEVSHDGREEYPTAARGPAV